jgi:hypothetical protein
LSSGECNQIHIQVGVGFERCEKKGEKSPLKFVPSSNYHKEEETLKPTKTNCASNPKPSLKPKRDVKKETPNPREEAFVCMFCGRAGHLDEFFFCRKKIEKRHLDYARNSYHYEFSDFPPRSFSRTSPCTSSRALYQFSHGPNHLAHMVLIHERTTLSLDSLVMTHVLIMVIVSCVGLIFLL